MTEREQDELLLRVLDLYTRLVRTTAIARKLRMSADLVRRQVRKVRLEDSEYDPEGDAYWQNVMKARPR